MKFLKDKFRFSDLALSFYIILSLILYAKKKKNYRYSSKIRQITNDSGVYLCANAIPLYFLF